MLVLFDYTKNIYVVICRIVSGQKYFNDTHDYPQLILYV